MRKQFKNILLSILSALIVLYLSVSPNTMGITVASASDQGPVAIILSSNNDSYRNAASAFAEEYNRPVIQLSLNGKIEEMPRVMNTIVKAKSPLILTLGAKATYAAKVWTATTNNNIPIIFAMVLNWRHFQFLDNQQNIMGIDMAPPPGSELAYLSMFAPNVKNIGIIHSGISTNTVKEIKESATLLGLNVKSIQIETPREFKTTFKKLSTSIDAYIAVRDPLAYSLDNLDWLTSRCINSGIVCLGRSEEMAQHGILLTVTPSPRDLALQAVSMTKSILSGNQQIANIGVTPPLSVRVVLNMQAAQKLDITITEAAYDAATEIIE